MAFFCSSFCPWALQRESESLSSCRTAPCLQIGRPLPLMVSTLPSCVPGAPFTLILPSGGQSTIERCLRHIDRQINRHVGLIATEVGMSILVVMSKSPAAPPFFARAPWPFRRTRPPSTAPAGTFTVWVSDSLCRGMRTVMRFSVPLTASSNVVQRHVHILAATGLRLAAKTAAEVPVAPQTHLHRGECSQNVGPNCRRSRRPPPPPKISSTLKPWPPPHPWGIWFLVRRAVLVVKRALLLVA